MSQIVYEKEKEMVLDNKRSDVIVIPVNMKALFFDKVGKRFESQFPNTAQAYRKLLLNESAFPGEALLFEENGFRIVLLVAQYSPYGKNIDDDATVVWFTTEAINQMILKLKQDTTFVSGLMFPNSIWKEVREYIKGLNVKWCIYLD